MPSVRKAIGTSHTKTNASPLLGNTGPKGRLLYSVEKQESAEQAAQKMQDKEAGGGGASGGAAVLGVKANEPGASGLYWDGNETSLGFLNLMVWKPIAMTGPAVVKQAGTQDTVNLLQKGVVMPVADELLPKRVYGYQRTERNNISGKTSTLAKGEGVLAHTNIQVKDLLTGATIYGIQWSYQTCLETRGNLSRAVLFDKYLRTRQLASCCAVR